MRQKKQVELNSDTGATGEARSAAVQETEARAARTGIESRAALAGPSVEAIVERENLKKALAQVKRNRGAPGIDSMSVDALASHLKDHSERSGNAPMEEIVMALKCMYGVDVGIDTTKLTPLANLVQRLTGVLVPTNKAIVGSGLYQIESGIIASWFKNCGEKNATELFPIRWSAVGQPPAEVVMGKGNGIDSIMREVVTTGLNIMKSAF